MNTEVDTYCRLCAELTPEEQMIKSDDAVAITSKTVTKMLWINVDISNNNLPTTICFSCYDRLERTWYFLHEVRLAQDKLCSIYANKIKLPPEQQPSENVTNAGKPVDLAWEIFKDRKSEVKLELDTHEIETVDTKSLLKDLNIKVEQNDSVNGHYSEDYDSLDSDRPLVNHSKDKKKKKLKKKKRKKRYEQDSSELLCNTDAVPLDMSWENYTWQCGNCDAQCKTVTSLRIHALEIHSRCCTFKCSDCSKTLTTYRAFINHVKVHYNHLKNWCELCDKSFSMVSYLKQHKAIDHMINPTLTCTSCGTSFESAEDLNDHIFMYGRGTRIKKEDKLETELKCDFCGKEFKSSSNLKAHRTVHTARTRDFSCHVCGKMFFTKGALRTHMAVHEDMKPYKCEFCQMGFKARGNLISHISLHSGTKPFICEQCGKSFRVKRHLKSHSIVHTDLMPYTCEYCNKQFRFKTRLNLHLRQHTGSRPYECFFCQRNFTNGSNYKKHMKRRHNIDTSKKKHVESVPTVTEPIPLDININENESMD